MPELHARGVELVVELLDAADNVHSLKTNDLAALLREAATVLGDLLKRDISPARAADIVAFHHWLEQAVLASME